VHPRAQHSRTLPTTGRKHTTAVPETAAVLLHLVGEVLAAARDTLNSAPITANHRARQTHKQQRSNTNSVCGTAALPAPAKPSTTAKATGRVVEP
jgi:hypothetical protein